MDELQTQWNTTERDEKKKKKKMTKPNQTKESHYGKSGYRAFKTGWDQPNAACYVLSN